MLFVETPNGMYIRRLYVRADPAGVCFEHGLLAELAMAHAVRPPGARATRAGETFAQVVVGGATALASDATPPGTDPNRTTCSMRDGWARRSATLGRRSPMSPRDPGGRRIPA